jgi:hypothetical protein
MFKVFLSSTSQDLSPFRAAVQRAIDRRDATIEPPAAY